MKSMAIARNVILLCVALFGANTISRAAGWTPPLTVTKNFTENSDLIVIYTSDGGAYASGCEVNSWMFTATTDARRARAYATVMTAMVTGKTIQFWYNDSCASWGYHDATAVALVN